MNPADYLSIPAFALKNNTSVDSVRRSIKRGLIPTVEILGRKAIHRDTKFVRSPIGTTVRKKPRTNCAEP